MNWSTQEVEIVKKNIKEIMTISFPEMMKTTNLQIKAPHQIRAKKSQGKLQGIEQQLLISSSPIP